MVQASSEVKLPKELEGKTNLVGGVWIDSKSGERFAVRSPVTGAVLAEVPKCGPSEADMAIAAAKAVWPTWRHTPVYKRAEIVLRIAELIRERAETIAQVLTVEQGKPYQGEALPEVMETALNFQLAAEDVVRMETPIIPMRDPAKRVLTFREPYGVMVVITPWNFPTVIPSEYLGPGLAVGNTIVMKPASTTPLSMILVAHCIQEALEEAGLPGGIFNLLTGPGATLGDYLVAHPDVALVGFTGETVTGEAICARAGIKMTLMELGGNGPVIVCADANLAEAAKAAAFGCFFNAGQVCCATERILVDKKVHDEFVALLLDEARQYALGDPMDPATRMGPLNNEPTAAKTEAHLADARAKGATILLGGARETCRPTDLYFPATVIDGVTRDMLLNREETFGPVAPVLTFESDQEAVEMANETGYGLQMAVFTSSLKRCFWYADRLRTGNIVVNDSTDYWEAHEPFGGGGGTKSGHGRLGGRYTLEDVTHLKTVAIDVEKTL